MNIGKKPLFSSFLLHSTTVTPKNKKTVLLVIDHKQQTLALCCQGIEHC